MVLALHINQTPIISMVVDPQDDASTSSTIAVQRTSPLKKRERKEKHVSFAPAERNETRCYEYTREDCKNAWYKPREYKKFRLMALDASQQIVATEKRNRAPFSYQRVMERVYDLCSACDKEQNTVLSSADFVHLQRWLEVATSRIGLEKWSIRLMAADKSSRRKALAQTVLDLQETHDLEDGGDGDAFDDQDDYEEYLRVSCERLSRTSRLFARTLAQAQAAAVQKENFFNE